MSDLRALLRVKTMAQAAATPSSERPSIDESIQIVGAYERLRGEARALHERAGWGTDDDFDRALPALHAPLTGGRAIVGAGQQARVLLGQLAAWAAGHQEASELEARTTADARARAEREAKEAQRKAFGVPPDARQP